MSSVELGKIGENLARVHLEGKGYRILTANYRSPYGEIDLIAEDTSSPEPTLVFVEVKARRTRRFGSPIQSVTPRKQQRLWQTAQHWLSHHLTTKGDPACRFDIVEVFMGSDGLSAVEHHVAVIIEA